ncbi:protein phosphatase 1 regulatory inhibitor subunit PPP1R8 homolog [Phoenix dactylifera]|uniref:Protein phosphatase 1 regulatory inhibitor subunit PPP1R8 homolog n=1 Tax=Phoenix dactylifera TaxID=42345 RepID=A0A8B7MSX4_PHODC|nr:protein phosphatase 1 regulatory inhibitor subunit PPP1R8 homolog [Phoenix dactylifera]
MYRGGLDRFKKAQSLEPFSVSLNSASKTALASKEAHPPVQPLQPQNSHITHTQHQQHITSKPTGPDAVVPAPQATQVGGGQSTWQPPDWAIGPRPGIYYLEVLKDGEVIDKINLDKRRHIFGRQFTACDFVLDHPSVSRQHAAVVPHKNGSIFVVDLGSAHGTFVANERLTKDNPVELEVGQSLRFAASTRSYILRKNTAALFPTTAIPAEINLPSSPDPSDEDAVAAYNTVLNRYGCISQLDLSSKSQNSSGSMSSGTDDHHLSGRSTKRIRKARVAFKDQVGGDLVEVVGISDGADVETEPGPIGVKEGSLVGKYKSLVQITVIPKGKEQVSPREDSTSPKGVTDRLQQVLNKVKSTTKSGIYDDLYGDSFSGKVGSSWAYMPDGQAGNTKSIEEKPASIASEKDNVSSADDIDDLFGDY